MTIISSITSISNIKSKPSKSLEKNTITSNKNEIQFSQNENDALISGIVYSIAALFKSQWRLFPDQHYKKEFLVWMNQMDVYYGNEEFLYRFKIFSDNVDKVENWNKEGSETVLGLNKFADLTNEEFKSIYISKGGIKLSSSNQHQFQKLQHQILYQ
ncbi:hypothetical protein ACTA71_008677 [Dictyostelium dimigraforme]